MTVWYVRIDGGTVTQATGLVNAPYPGSGLLQPCAFSNPQDAFNAASLGDTISIRAGDSFSGNFTLVDKGVGTSYITVQSSAASLLPSGVRVGPTSLANMASLTTPNGGSALSFQADSHHWKFIGIAATTTNIYPTSQRCPFLISSADSNAFGHWPNHITFDRCLVYAAETDPLPYRSAEEGFAIDGSDITIQNCYVYNFFGWEYPSATVNTVVGATNANPVKLTLGTPISNPGHKFLMFLEGGTGSWTALNGPAVKVATYVDSTHVTLQNYDANFNLTNIDSTSFGALTGTVIQRNQNIATSRGILIQIGPGPYTIDNNFIEAYYTPIFTGGGGTWIDPQNSVTVNAVVDLNTVTLSSLGQLQVGDLIAFSAMQDQTITGATAGNPTRLTVQATRYPVITNLNPEGYITVSGFTGAWAPLNGKWGGNGNSAGNGIVTVPDTTHLTIPVDSTGFGAVTSSSPKWVTTTKDNSGAKQWQVGKVTGINGLDVTTQWRGHQPDNTNGNGNGILVAVGATANFRGLDIHDVTVTRNTISVRRDWIWLIRDVAKTCDNCSGQPPKASWEAKQGNNITIDGNIFQIEGGNLSPNGGTVTLALNQANQVGSTPWVSLNNWTITNNIFRNYTYIKLSQIEEYETGVASSVINFSNNLLTPSNASFISLEGTDSVTIEHNTSRNFGTGSSTSGGYNAFLVIFNTNTNSVIRNNIGNWVSYGYVDFSTTWVPAVRTHDYLIDSANVGFSPPAGDVRIANVAAMGFTDIVAADAGNYQDYQLTPASIGHNAATDGTDVGINWPVLAAAVGLNPSSSGVTISGAITTIGNVVFS